MLVSLTGVDYLLCDAKCTLACKMSLLSTLVTIVTVAHFLMWHHRSSPVVGQCILITFSHAHHDHAHLAGAKRCDMTNSMGVEQICLHNMRYSDVSCFNTVLFGLFDKGGLSSNFIAYKGLMGHCCLE